MMSIYDFVSPEKGLEKSPKFMYDSMAGTVSPELTAESAVLVNGGFDPCRDAVTVTPECEEGWQSSDFGDPFCLKVRWTIES